MREAAGQLLAATEARRVELGKKWKQVYEEAGVTHQTLNRWRNGHPVAPLTERALERALDWAPGAREAIAAGGEPTPVGEGAPPPDPGRGPTLEQELELGRRLLASTVRELGLSPDEADEAWRLAREDIVRTHRPAEPSEGAPPVVRDRRTGT